jgi:hypothetical protein
MSLEKIYTQIVSSVWQGIAQSGVDLSNIPHDKQDKLVRSIADRMMLTMNTVLDDVVKEETRSSVVGTAEMKPADNDLAEDEEKILWEGKPFLTLNESYVITSERIKIIRGLLSRQVENYELVRMQDVDFKQNVGERMLGIGDIFIKGHDPSDPQVTLRDIHNPEEVYEILRRAWMESRKRHGLQFREYM